jgi:hypothetical protein
MLQLILANESHLYQMVFTTFTIQSKLRFFHETINNPFLNPDDFSQTFYRVIKIYNGFRKFVNLYRFMKANIVVTTDFNLSELDPCDKQVICIKQQNNRYLFHINDLLHIVEGSLSASHALFSTPQMIKNPYTNLPFNKSTLYNIYFQGKNEMKGIVTSRTSITKRKTELFDLYFQHNFNIKLFGRSCEHILREYAIKEYVYKSDDDIMREEIDEMVLFLNNVFGQDILIDPDFPTKTLIQIMRPYVMLWFTNLCSLIPPKQTMAQKTLYAKWSAFIEHNPQFGRKTVRLESKFTNFRRIDVRVVEFNCDAPRFVSDHSPAKFMKNHLFL